MIWSNEELTSIAEDTRIDITTALDNVTNVEEYAYVQELLQEALDVLNEIAEVYEEAYERECKEQQEYENREYVRSVL